MDFKQDEAIRYWIQLISGRILGPLPLPEVSKLILKNQVTSLDRAKKNPNDPWQDINQFPEIVILLSEHAQEAFKKKNTEDETEITEYQKIELDFSSLYKHSKKNTLKPPKPKSTEPSISSEETVLIKKSDVNKKSPGILNLKLSTKPISLILFLAVFILFFYPETKPIKKIKRDPIRPELPSLSQGITDSKASGEIYQKGLRQYLQDHVEGYRIAATQFLKAITLDSSNIKAIGMLASTYLNLIDSSNKDESYFSVISKLIDLSRAKSVDLPETVIADVEFFLVINKTEAAQSRIVEYTNTHASYGLEMFYYLSAVFFARQDASRAAKYISQFPESKIFTPKIFYLRGQIAEKLNDLDTAMNEYQKAISYNKNHAKSYLRLSHLLSHRGKLGGAANYLNFLLKNAELLSPPELGETYYLHCQLAELQQQWSVALGDIEKAIELDAENHDYLLELYTLRARVQNEIAEKSLETNKKQLQGNFKKAQQEARMYFFLGEGEKLIKLGKYQEALIPLLQAREANDSSYLPLIKIGDMFNYLHDIENAKLNYRLATLRASNNIQVWSKYIDSLIQSYEWVEAQKAMDRFRQMNVNQGVIDKAAGDMYQKQGRFIEAQSFYRKAMQREVIEPSVYLAYAKSLMKTKNYKEAPFFFSLALRFDPLNIEAVINNAKCIAEAESIDRAINALQDELQKSSEVRSEYLDAIAELQIQKGAWDQSQRQITQAMATNPNDAYAWKLQAKIYMNQENTDKTALSKALLAYKSYSDRNASDPSGYLERYKIYLKKAEFENAQTELMRIFEIYPHYPNLHFYLGTLYTIQGNHKIASEEFIQELQNHPNNAQTLVALGKEYLEMGNFQKALDQFSKAMLFDPSSNEARQNAGWANFYLKNYQAAISLLRLSIVKDRGNPLLHKRLGFVFKEMGDTLAACDSFKRYLEMEPDATDKADFSFCF